MKTNIINILRKFEISTDAKLQVDIYITLKCNAVYLKLKQK